MICVRLINNDYRYDVTELIKVFYFNQQVVFIDTIRDYSKGLLIEVGLIDRLAFTKVYKDSKLIYEVRIDMGSVNIGIVI